MSYTTEKLEYLKGTKAAIKAAIIAKGQPVADGDTFRSYADKIAAIEAASPELKWVTFMSYDGTVELGRKAVAEGDDCADPIARGIFAKPTKPSTAAQDFEQNGWATEPNGAADSNALKSVTADRVLYAAYKATTRKYTITFLDADGSTLSSQSVAYGTVPSIANPAKDGYDFVAWEPALVAVTGNATYTAKWKEKTGFGIMSWADIKTVADNGEAANYFKLGDLKTVTLTHADGTTEDVTFEIVDLENTISQSLSAKIGILATHTLKDYREYNGSTSGSDMYYAFSSLLPYLNTTLTNALPEDMIAALKTVSMPFASGNSKVHIPTSQMLYGYEYAYSGSHGNVDSWKLKAFLDGKSTVCNTMDGANAEYWVATTAKSSSGSKLCPTYVNTSGVLKAQTNYGGVKKGIRLLCFI